MIGCLRYGTGFETLRERDDHVRSHNRPSKCPERGCFYEEVGFANERTLNQHISLCHTDPSFNRFEFPKFRKQPPPAADERQRFREAIRREDLGLLRDMIHKNGSLRGQLSPGSLTALGHAALYGKLESVRCLLECGCNIGPVSDRGTALHAACHSKKTDVVQLLLSNSTSEELNSKDKKGRTPLSFLVDLDTNDTVRLIWVLLAHVGVEVDAKDNNGQTPLSLAASKGSVHAVKPFLEHDGVDVNAKDNEGQTPLSLAARNGFVGVVELLLENGRGVDANAKDNKGRTPLSLAASEGLVSVVKLFLEHSGGVDVNAKDNKGRTPLSWAAGSGKWSPHVVSVVKMLLAQDRVDVDAKDDAGRTPLSWAASTGTVDVIKLFLEHGEGVDVNADDNKGRTPLAWAMARESYKMAGAKLLVEYGGR